MAKITITKVTPVTDELLKDAFIDEAAKIKCGRKTLGQMRMQKLLDLIGEVWERHPKMNLHDLLFEFGYGERYRNGETCFVIDKELEKNMREQLEKEGVKINE